jgi:hypothetical protein
MRFVILAIGALVAACAGQSEPKAPLMASATPVAQGDAQATKVAKVDTDALVQAQKMGYRIVNQDGETLYCRKEAKTGSRTEIETVCLTAQEIETMRTQTQQSIKNVSEQVLPPPSH